MKKILHISKYYYPFIGGVEQVARDCVNALKEECQQKVICFNHEKGNKVDVIDSIEITRVNCQAKISSQSIAFSYGKYLKRILNDFKPDFVIFHYPNPFVSFFLDKYLKNKQFKFILYWHLDITKQKILGRFFKKQNQRLLKFADRIIATSPNYIDGSQWLIPYKYKCKVIPCCVNEERLKYNKQHIKMSEDIKKMYEGKVLLFAFGRHVEYKGLKYLIQASKILSDEKFIVLIGGHGPLTDVLKKESDGDAKIKFLGKLSDDDLKSYLLACDIFCFPSITKNEAFGIGLAEAMYYHKPSITFTIPGSGVNFVNLNKITGLECDNKDVQQYANAIESLANNHELCINYGDLAYERVIKYFTYSSFKKEILDLIKEI